jgi:hypothetical protein
LHGRLVLLQFRQWRADRRDERPVRFEIGALLDPLLEQVDVLHGERLAAVGRRHLFAGIGRGDPADQLAFGELAGDNRGRSRFELARGPFERVQPQVGVAGFVVEPVALVAGVAEDGANIAAKIEPLVRGCGGSKDERQQGDGEASGCTHRLVPAGKGRGVRGRTLHYNIAPGGRPAKRQRIEVAAAGNYNDATRLRPWSAVTFNAKTPRRKDAKGKYHAGLHR